jgi:hypothetical protein
MNTFAVRCLHEPMHLLSLRSQINALNLASEQPDPFSTAEFYANFLERGLLLPQSESQLWFLAVFADTELVGYLALKRVVRRVLGVATHGLEFLVGHEVDRPHLVARAAHLEAVSRAVFDYLLERRDQWSWLELQGQTAVSALDPTQLGLRLPGHMTRDFPNWENCTIQLRWRTVQQYVQAMSSNMRGELRRRLRRLLGLGQLELLSSSDPQATPALFDLYCSIEQRSWKSETEVAIGGVVQAEYVRGLLAADQPMRIVIHILLLDGAPIAGLICGLFTAPAGTTLYALHLAYDRHFAAASPGSAVLLMGVRHAIEQGCTSINLLAGFTYYKRRWLAAITPRRSIQVYRHGSPFAWRRMLGDALRRARGKSQGSPAPNPLRPAQVVSRADSSGSARLAAGRLAGTLARGQFAAKIAQAHLGRCETLTASEIEASAAVITEPKPPAPVPKRRRVSRPLEVPELPPRG